MKQDRHDSSGFSGPEQDTSTTAFTRTKSEQASPAQVRKNVSRLVCSVIEDFRTKLTPLNITLETDLDEVEAYIDPSLVRIVAAGLLENASESLIGGGEISVTLIDGQHQWELEVADSAHISSEPSETVFSIPTGSELTPHLPFPQSESLRNAHRAATAHQGQIQTWSCPQGGTAHVFVASQRQLPTHSSQSNPPLDPTRHKI
ncbi:MAG: K+-sensing histidine kinase KdpD [Mariniblastus sp.]|jgi:K+-sensing histidine kinase KdpD